MNSIGFLSYKIKTKTDLPNNAVISHQAQIFFDANTSIVTNTVFHTVVDSIQNVLVVSTASVITPENYTVKVMPNPMQDRATIEIMPLGNSILTNTKVQLYNVAGQLVQEKYFTGNTCVITRDNLPQGCYYYTIQNDKQAIARGKILILK
jgi:hypothetical protein